MTRLSLVPIALIALTGCGLQFGSLSQEWELDRIRILGARSTPAELRPDELGRLEALTYAPSGEVGVIWALCDPFATAACPDPAVVESIQARDFSGLTEDEELEVRGELGALGILGVDPHLPASLYIPSELLADLPPELLAEGLPLPIDLVAFAPGYPDEYAVKRVIVSESQTPNNNPSFEGITVDGAPIGLGADIELEADGTVELDVLPGAGAVETYLFVTDEGVEEERTEHLEARWYSESGVVDAVFDISELRGTTRAGFTPDAPTRLYCVLTDGRGGMAWTEHLVTVR